MWGKCVESLANIVSAVFFALAIWDKKRRKKWFVALTISAIASLYTSSVPIENVFYSFPTAEAVAKYACKGEVIDILAGEESSLILYSEEPGTVSYMLSNKTGAGYKHGPEKAVRRHSHLTAAYQAQVLIYESAHAIDKYAYVIGILEGKDVVVADTEGNHFYVFQKSGSYADTERTFYEAFCILSDTDNETYEIAVNSTAQSITIRPENE